MAAPESMTYDSLIADISAYSERDDEPFMEQRSRFVMMAENRLAAEVRGLGFLQVVTTTLSGATLAKPERWRETKSFAVTISGTMSYLQSRSYQYCRSFNPTAATGAPRYYSDEEYEYWYIAPVPAGNYDAEIQYHERPEPLSAENQTNWTTQYAPQLLLYASMVEACVFRKLPDKAAEFQQLYDRALLANGKEDEKRLRPDAAAVRS